MRPHCTNGKVRLREGRALTKVTPYVCGELRTQIHDSGVHLPHNLFVFKTIFQVPRQDVAF